ncbi:unnamed protein product, partial [Meganyctiphanes norvegica]
DLKADVKVLMEAYKNKSQLYKSEMEDIKERQMLNETSPANNTQDKCNTDFNLKEIDFGSIGGKAGATSFYGDCCTPAKGFHGPEWHSGKSTLPQALWFHFDQPIKVVLYSFNSRPTDQVNLKADGPSKYAFFGSNSTDCSDQSSWVVLKEDTSGTPFSVKYASRTEYVNHPDVYSCYGFKVIDVPGRYNGDKWAIITGVRFFYV